MSQIGNCSYNTDLTASTIKEQIREMALKVSRFNIDHVTGWHADISVPENLPKNVVRKFLAFLNSSHYTGLFSIGIIDEYFWHVYLSFCD